MPTLIHKYIYILKIYLHSRTRRNLDVTPIISRHDACKKLHDLFKVCSDLNFSEETIIISRKNVEYYICVHLRNGQHFSMLLCNYKKFNIPAESLYSQLQRRILHASIHGKRVSEQLL